MIPPFYRAERSRKYTRSSLQLIRNQKDIRPRFSFFFFVPRITIFDHIQTVPIFILNPLTPIVSLFFVHRRHCKMVTFICVTPATIFILHIERIKIQRKITMTMGVNRNNDSLFSRTFLRDGRGVELCFNAARRLASSRLVPYGRLIFRSRFHGRFSSRDRSIARLDGRFEIEGVEWLRGSPT